MSTQCRKFLDVFGVMPGATAPKGRRGNTTNGTFGSEVQPPRRGLNCRNTGSRPWKGRTILRLSLAGHKLRAPRFKPLRHYRLFAENVEEPLLPTGGAEIGATKRQFVRLDRPSRGGHNTPSYYYERIEL